MVVQLFHACSFLYKLSFLITEGQLLTIMADLFVAGTETTATTIRWTILYLINNPDIQNKMLNEIEENVGCNRMPNMSDRFSLPYCEAVIIETLRLGNVVPFALPHKASEEIVYNGYTIPKDSIIIPSLDSIVYDEQLFPEAEKFKPERFLDQNGKVCGQEKVPSFSLGEFFSLKFSKKMCNEIFDRLTFCTSLKMQRNGVIFFILFVRIIIEQYYNSRYAY